MTSAAVRPVPARPRRLRPRRAARGLAAARAYRRPVRPQLRGRRRDVRARRRRHAPRRSCRRSSALRPFPARHMSMESIYEYGSRAGVWRLLREFERRGATAHRVRRGDGARAQSRGDRGLRRARARDRMPRLALDPLPGRRRRDRGRCTCGARSRSTTRLTGSAPAGWYTGRDSPNTRRLVVEHGGFLYDSDNYGDDLPFWTVVRTQGGRDDPASRRPLHARRERHAIRRTATPM